MKVAIMIAVVALGLAGCGAPDSRPTAGASPDAAAFAQLPIELTVNQRTTTPLPGSVGPIRLTIDDVTRGQVMTSLAAHEGTTLLAPTSLREGDTAPFQAGSRTYSLRLKTLTNNLIGNDSATFVVEPDGAVRPASATIETLITAVANMDGAVFIRNGAEYSAGDAADHLRAKWQAAGEAVTTVDEFLRQVAGGSWLTGKPYRVRFADGSTRLLVDVLRERRAEIERHD